jgi:hypothetical protein
MPGRGARHTCRHDRATAGDQGWSATAEELLLDDDELLDESDVEPELLLSPALDDDEDEEPEEEVLPDDDDPSDGVEPAAVGPSELVCCAGTVDGEVSPVCSAEGWSTTAAEFWERPRGTDVSPGART